MKCNIGHADRVLRMTIGIIPFVTGAIGNCPAYSILGMNTAKK